MIQKFLQRIVRTGQKNTVYPSLLFGVLFCCFVGIGLWQLTYQWVLKTDRIASLSSDRQKIMVTHWMTKLHRAPNSAEIQFNVGVMFMGMGEYEKALSMFQDLLALQTSPTPLGLYAKLNTAICYRHLNDPKKAILLLDVLKTTYLNYYPSNGFLKWIYLTEKDRFLGQLDTEFMHIGQTHHGVSLTSSSSPSQDTFLDVTARKVQVYPSSLDQLSRERISDSQSVLTSEKELLKKEHREQLMRLRWGDRK